MGSEYTPYEGLLLPINKNILPYGPDGVEFPFPYDMSWVFGLGIAIAFAVSMGIGANDVANSFATSVGSKSLTIVQALVIAGIFEFSGAVLLGASVTDTVRGGLVDPADFDTRPDLLMIGMLCALVSVAFWLFIATAFEMPVSTTHSTVGAVLGFGLCLPQMANIDWGGVGEIVASWFISPALSALFSSSFYLIIRTTVLSKENSLERTFKAFPLIVWFTVTVNVFFIIIKGGKSKGWTKKLGGEGAAFGVATAIGFVIGALVYFAATKFLRKRLENLEDTEKANAGVDIESAGSVDLENKGDFEGADHLALQDPAQEIERATSVEKAKTWKERQAEKIHGDQHKNDRVSAIHNQAEVYDYRTEKAFGYLQVFTACMMSFAHGANDVANAIGPLASIAEVYHTNGQLSKKSAVPTWILVLGGAGLVVGLALFGYKVIRALGVKLIKVTPARGSCIELATAFVIVIGSIFGLPLSTTHTMVGASLGVGIVDGFLSTKTWKGGFKAINGKLLLKVVSGWVATIVVAAAVSAAVFSLIVYGPSVTAPIASTNCLVEYGTKLASDATIPGGATALAGLSDGNLIPLQ